jgi:non-canonical purine NTP pyrophosphatase (RdgB/HAM1 family)
MLVEKRRLDKRTDPGKIAIPSGGIEENESPESALIRETKEELNITPTKYSYICTLSYQHTKVDFVINYFLIEKWIGKIKNKEADKIFWINSKKPKELDISVDKKAIEILNKKISSKTVCLVTSNEDRHNFVKKAFAQFDLCVERVSLKLNEIQADTVKEVATAKALSAAKTIGKPCICEDTELCIKALKNFPGTYMKFAQARLTSEKIILLMKDEKNKSAMFRSTIVYAEPDGFHKTFETKINGTILTKKKGNNGRGWDSIFQINESKKTLAEYEPSERFEIWNKGYLELGRWLSTKKVI